MHRDIYTHLAELRRKYHGQKFRAPFPDLSVPPSPCTNGFGPTPARAPMGPVDGLLVDTLHKQGMQVLLRSELPWAGGRKS